MTVTLGLDVGGAHLKAAVVEKGRTRAVSQFVCPLWQGLDKLSAALAEAAPLRAGVNRVGVTMTGELSDLFPDRRTGVAHLVAELVAAFGPDTQFWMGRRGFGPAASALAHHRDVGSTNFLATATLLARHVPDALLIDFGSTSTDIIPIRQGAAVPSGLTDVERQTAGELVYTGLTRTAVMAVTDRAPLHGRWVGLAREYLATMADVRRILGELPDGVDLHATADGKGKSRTESLARFARMLGCDAADAGDAEWETAAQYVRECQMRSIHDGALQVLSASALPSNVPVIAAGIGWRPIERLSQRLGLVSRAFAECANAPDELRETANHAAPAVAIALLLDGADG